MNAVAAADRVPAIQARGVSKSFGEGETRVIAVNAVSLTVYCGEMLFLVGPSGSGKTTLLSMLSGILRPDDGSVEIGDLDLWAMGANDLADFRLHNIGFVFQDFHLFPRLTSAENVAIPLILKGCEWDAAIAAANHDLGVVGLASRTTTLPVSLSGGEQQRVAIARAIVGGPRILILDEPTASLDGDTGRTIIAFVKEEFLNAERSILIVTHDARINEYADRILHMEDGVVTAFEKGTE